ncbi:Na/Pi cotransporter family protein [Lachnotalea sp. AF33-28]|uniref:Na/Pi cotransporter family protein n=1 Tax=Lachnotalea sp. AF33-28 TaxID=2292046 RepID=UPI000E468F84|nr:Na/Pi cotransporter family protein [Lachnotalea sp. AF33-28]RHP31768.1 Na/Pi cotransporter family protein [Lachnotalea sp. AF33-28]
MKISDLEMLFKFIGGLGMFLYGMHIMAEGLQQSAGDRMKKMLGFLTNNRLLAVLMGALITAIIQSSSATTVMIVGFVNAGIINLTQAVGVIMGANIGTTITSWIVSMSEWGEVMKPEFFAPLIIGIGALLFIFMKSEKKKDLGEILLGFGVLFIGLSFMSGAIKPYRDAPVFADAFRILGRNPFFGVLAGALVTAVIQSSSASVGILQTLAMNGVVTWNSAVFITLGQNIGTCVTALLASAGAHKTAKRAAVIHLLFNVFGAGIFGVLMFAVFQFYPAWGAGEINSIQISVFHTVFNVTNTILLFPFAGYLVKLSERLIKEENLKQPEGIAERVKNHLDSQITRSPSFAIEAAIHEVLYMGEIALENARLAIDAVIGNRKESLGKIYETEETINELEGLLTEYLIQINSMNLTENQALTVKDLLYTISDLERMGDHSENIAELTEQKISKSIEFSEDACRDLRLIGDNVINAVKAALDARRNSDPADIRRVLKLEDEVDNCEEDLREKHIERLSLGQCTPQTGVIFLDVISNLERICDHANNVAGYVKNEL